MDGERVDGDWSEKLHVGKGSDFGNPQWKQLGKYREHAAQFSTNNDDDDDDDRQFGDVR